jgi:ElaA protein
LNWIEKTFPELTAAELHDLLRLRSEVFVVEQQCAYQDIDGADPQAVHLLCYDDGHQLLAYSRLFAPGVKSEMASVGRVVTSEQARGKGLGRELMERSLAAVAARFNRPPIRIWAQEHLKAFYTSLGFRQSSESYLWDNIPHIEMIREPLS